jgi:ribosomal protein S18 acetylase RimI-like enzyme
LCASCFLPKLFVHHLSQTSSLFNVRLAQPKDVASLSDILTTSFYCDDNREHAYLTQWLQPFIRWGISLDLGNRLADDSPRYACLVATQIDNPSNAIATVEMGLRQVPRATYAIPLLNWQAPQYPYLFNLAVHPGWRRRGVAAQLLTAAEKLALRWGFQQLYLHVLENNLPARQLYQQSGYQFHKVEPGIRLWLINHHRRLLLRKVIN